VLLCVNYQLNFTIFMYVTGISRYITLYIAFGIVRSFTLPQQVLERINRGYGGPPVFVIP